MSAKTLREVAATYGVELPDCGDSSCIFGSAGGMRTNGGCRCDGRDSAARELRLGARRLGALVLLIDQRLENLADAMTPKRICRVCGSRGHDECGAG